MDAEATVNSLGLPFHSAAQLRLICFGVFFVNFSLEYFLLKLKCELKQINGKALTVGH